MNQILERIGYLVGGTIYGSLGFEAFYLINNTQSDSAENSDVKSIWTAKVLAQPFGSWLVIMGGIIIIGIGFYRLYQSYKGQFLSMLDLNIMNQQQKTLVIQISRLGIIAKGVVLLIIGFFLIQAGRNYNPNQAIGLEGVLQVVQQQTFGQFLLGLLGLGLFAYAIYLGIQARYGKIPQSLDNSESNFSH